MTQTQNQEIEMASAQMPEYRSHKKVWALQIGDDVLEIMPDGGAKLVFINGNYAPRIVAKEVISRYLPRCGDYFVVYADGYESISPKAAFEDGYTLIQGV